MIAEPVIGRVGTRITPAPALRDRLTSLAAGRPLVIDYYAARLRGVPVGDMVASFREPGPEPRYVELEPIGDVVVLAERHLVEILEGANLRDAGPPWHRHLAISPARPEEWIDFLDRHPSRIR